MNAYAIAALVGVLFVEAVELGGILLNLRALDPKVPAEFADLYDAETYRRSQEYTRARTRLGIVSSLFDLAVLLAFWFAGGFGRLDGVVRDWGLGPIWGGLVFLVILFAALWVLGLPFKIWAVFVTEERFGFNRTSPGTFALDSLKGIALSAVLEIPLAIAFLALFEYGGRAAWVYAWLAVAAFTLLIQFLAPKVIMPLFNKFTPLEDGELKDAVFAYAERVDFPLKELFTMDASRRSSKGNAFFTGFGKNRRIALFDTLIQRHNTDELVTILAHEVGHYKKRHVLVGTVLSMVEMGVFLGLFALLVDQAGLFEAFRVDEPSVYAGVIFVPILLRPLQLVLSVASAALSRHHERVADSFAMTTTGRGDLLAAGLRRLSKDNLSNLTPHPFYVFLEYSHPPLLQRVRALEVGHAGPDEPASARTNVPR
ncbi:MAG: M48 family metallopeptidase [Thermoleophilia bacterium]|nr:M48 family metallopeptidase [Thermoleophilia bacterium]